MKLSTILVPLDGSSLAGAALPKALELAEVSGARLLLLRTPEAPVELPAGMGEAVAATASRRG